MKVEKILPCVCTKELESVYDGMPRLMVCGGKPNTYFSPYCPRCGRGLDNHQYVSAFLALRGWNEMQEEARRNPLDIFEGVYNATD